MKCIFLVFTILSTLAIIISCAAIKPLITEIPQLDLDSKVIFYDEKHDKFSVIAIDDSLIEKSTRKFNKNLILKPSISPFGTYVGCTAGGIKLALEYLFTNKIPLKIYDINKEESVLDIEINIPSLEYFDETYSIPWSEIGSGFFIVKSDSILKYYPDGSNKFLFAIPKLRYFSVSPSENMILVYHSGTIKTSDMVSLYYLNSGRLEDIQTVNNFLGLRTKYIHGIAWSRDEKYLAFAIGWKIYIYDIDNADISEHKVKGKIFNIEWIDENELLYV